MRGDSSPRFSPALQAAVAATGVRLRIGYPWWLRLVLIRGIAGITLGRRVYLASGIAGAALERLLRHELAHVHQIALHGLLRFYWRYVVEYVSLRRRGLPPAEAYRNISFEREALEAEENV